MASPGDSVPELLTVRQVAEIFQVRPETIRLWIKQGRIETIPRPDIEPGQRGQEIRIPRSAIYDEDEEE